MFSIEMAREQQRKKQKTVLLKFVGLLALLLAVLVAMALFTVYLQQYPVLYFVFALLAFLTGKSSGIFGFLEAKECEGIVVESTVKMEPQRRYAASNQPGTNYASHDVPVLTLTVETAQKKRKRKTVPYQWAWGEYPAGEKVALLRFVDRPVLLKD